MPTDLDAARARKRSAQKENEKQRQTNVTLLSIWTVVCLVMIVLLFVDRRYAQAMEELIGLF